MVPAGRRQPYWPSLDHKTARHLRQVIDAVTLETGFTLAEKLVTLDAVYTDHDPPRACIDRAPGWRYF